MAVSGETYRQIGRTAVPALLTLIQAEEFDGRPLPEKRAFFEALGTAGREEVLPLVKQALARKSLLKRGSSEELRACACEALGHIGGREAEMLLHKAMDDRSPLVRTAAQSALRHPAGAEPGREAA